VEQYGGADIKKPPPPGSGMEVLTRIRLVPPLSPFRPLRAGLKGVRMPDAVRVDAAGVEPATLRAWGPQRE
jgi:hypothetical protein